MQLYRAVRPLIFSLPAEVAHHAALRALCAPFWLPRYTPPASLATRVWSLNFPSPIGLAAGFDKNAQVLHAVQKAGFGFAEIGTLTPLPQAGNPSPRMFRLPAHEAIINRLGFNNEGVDGAAVRLTHRPHGLLVGGNIGKNKDSADALHDYVTCLRKIYAQVDYLAVNISSPNTPGLRDLQQAKMLRALMQAVQDQRTQMVRQGAAYKPIVVKLAPDLDIAALEETVAVLIDVQVDGLILTNTTLAREAVADARHAHESGGLSGKPLMHSSTAMLAKVYQLTQGKIPLIGVGGVASAEDAYAKILAGASLVQLYSALIYQGLGLVKTISEGLPALLARDGFSHISDAVGKAAL